MGTTPLWVPLLVAAIAVIGTLAGVAFTQVWNSRLEERRYTRENARLREAQAREDLNRTYDHRRAAYVEFHQEFDRVLGIVNSSKEPVPAGVFAELGNRYTPIRIYGTYEADTIAFRCLNMIQDWGQNPDDGVLADDVYSAAVEYVSQIRKDLGVPEWKPAELPKPPEPKPATGQQKR